MPKIIAVSVVDLPYRVAQTELKDFARKVFSGGIPDIETKLQIFENAKIDYRNLAVPVDFFYSESTFSERNDLFRKHAVENSVRALNCSLKKSGIDKEQITDIIFVSTTGISTPSPDALIINDLKLTEKINRLPIWGLGCAGGVAGIAKANVIAKANPKAVVAVVTAELCSLTFLRNDISKRNLIAASLFSDGIACALIAGDEHIKEQKLNCHIKILDSQSRIYYDSLNVMGWDILDEGFRVVFSKDIPEIVSRNVKNDIMEFLRKHKLELSDIGNFIVHPGGTRVINAYIDSLKIDPSKLNNTRSVLRDYGNLSSSTVLYVLNKFIENGFEDGFGLMMSLGPGFSSELVLLKLDNQRKD